MHKIPIGLAFRGLELAGGKWARTDVKVSVLREGMSIPLK